MDAVVDVRSAAELHRLGGVAVVNLEGVQTRYEDPAEVLLRIAGHLVWPAQFVMPHVRELRPRWMIRAGLFLYDHLARRDARRLLVIGTGALAPTMAEAHCAVRSIERVEVWGRQPARAAATAAQLASRGLPACAVDDLDRALGEADIVTCATTASAPIVHGAKLRPGTHVDLVGAFTPRMRETDDEAVRRARVFVDTFAGALKEAGDLVQPLDAGAIERAHVLAELADLCAGRHPGRTRDDEITLFKSVGTALEDLCAARLVGTRSVHGT